MADEGHGFGGDVAGGGLLPQEASSAAAQVSRLAPTAPGLSTVDESGFLCVVINGCVLVTIGITLPRRKVYRLCGR